MNRLLLDVSRLAVALVTIVATSATLSDESSFPSDCGNPFENGAVGPYDYRNARDRETTIRSVEAHHLNKDVETLTAGQTGAYIMTDLDYVLRAIPNHHRALASLMRYAPRRLPQERQYYRTECYFHRAATFAPDDATVRLIFGVYLAGDEKFSKAEEEYLKAIELQPEYAEAYYNLGLLYVSRGDLDSAKLNAEKAYSLGYPLPGLKRRLEKDGIRLDN